MDTYKKQTHPKECQEKTTLIPSNQKKKKESPPAATDL